MRGFTVDVNKCQRDAICMSVCPAGVIKKASSEGYPEPTADFETFCLACGHCVAVCPNEALSLAWLSPEMCLPINPKLNLTVNQVEQLLRSRRSIRTFKEEQVDQGTLKKLLEIATCAPSAKNEQPWHWIVIQDPSEVKRLANLVVDWMRVVIKEKPDLAREKAYHRIVAAWKKGKDAICRAAPHLIVVHANKELGFGPEDCASALTYLEIIATTLGVGTCWAGYLYRAANVHMPLFEALGIPSGHWVFGAMMVGYPKFKYHRLPLRNPPRVIWK